MYNVQEELCTCFKKKTYLYNYDVYTLCLFRFLMAASFGAGIILILDPKGEKKRYVVVVI